MHRTFKLWALSAALGVALVSVPFWNVVLHENGSGLVFILWPGLIAAFLAGYNYHDGSHGVESVIMFATSAAVWTAAFFCLLLLAKSVWAGLKKPRHPPEPIPASRDSSS